MCLSVSVDVYMSACVSVDVCMCICMCVCVCVFARELVSLPEAETELTPSVHLCVSVCTYESVHVCVFDSF